MNEELRPLAVALLGIPSDANSSFLRGCADAPQIIREMLFEGASNLCSEQGIDLDGHPLFRNAGDLMFIDGPEMHLQVEEGVREILEGGERTLCLGGDHAITYPIIRAYAKLIPNLTILHFDAHPDLYDHYEGNRYSHASPFARIMEEGLVKRLVQVGIRTQNDHQRAQARRFGVETVDMRHFGSGLQLLLQGPTYISIDLDALDPAYAPGVSHQEPGGLSTRDILGLIASLEGPIVGADIVEYNPSQDVNHMTARVAAKFVRELGGAMVTSLPRNHQDPHNSI